MSHVRSFSEGGPEGEYLYTIQNKKKVRIGGPYPSPEYATAKSKAVSEAVGEGSVGEYKDWLSNQSIWDFYGPDFPQELAGFGRLSPSSKLGLYTDPYHARAIDLGVNPSEWEGETRGFMAPITKPQSLWDFTESELREDQPIEGLLRDNFTPPTEQLERGDYLVGLSNIAPDPYNLDTWHHEYGHVGQRVATDTPIDSSDTKRSRLTSNVRADDEALQRARDLLYSTSQKEFDKDVEAFTDDWYGLGYDISSERFRELIIQVMMEDLGANKKLDEMGVSRGAPPDLTLINKLMKKLGKKPIKPFAPPRWLEWLY